MIQQILLSTLRVYVIAIMIINVFQEVAVFHPSKEIKQTPDQLNMVYEEFFIPVKNKVALSAWFIPSKGSRATMLFFHGNAGNNADRMLKLEMFHDLGLNVVIVDYRGFGHSNGRASATNFQKDALKVYDYLIEQKMIRPKQIVIYGESIGGVAAVAVAQQREAAALILDSTFTTSADMVHKLLPMIPSFLVYSSMNSYDKIADIHYPKLFIHSREDRIVPYALGQKLYEKARTPKQFLEISGGHNDGFYISRKRYVMQIKSFLEKLDLVSVKTPRVNNKAVVY